MFVFDMFFSFDNFKLSEDEIDYLLTSYLCTLSGNNQIVFETINISGEGHNRVVRLSTPFEDSTDTKYYDKYTAEQYKTLSKYLETDISIIYIGEDHTYSEKFSTGENTDFYVLSSHPNLRDISPLCDKHNIHIPAYLLPTLSDDTLCEMTSWETNYAAYDRLFYVTGIGEMSAHRMLSNVNSKLNQKGFKVCRMLEDELQKPVYYYLMRCYGKHPSSCPLCGGEWKQSEQSIFGYKCDKCKIVAYKSYF